MTQTKTKACLHPWKTTSILGNGAISPCCGQVHGYFGNLGTDIPSEAETPGKHIFQGDDYPKLRESLLSGNLYDDCKNCRIIAEEDIGTDELKRRVVEHLSPDGVEIDLLRSFRITDLLIGITNKCNLRCVYCPQSAPKKRGGADFSHSLEFYNAYIPEETFFALVDYLLPRGLKRLNFVGIGEFTVYRNWKSLTDRISRKYPELHIQLVTNLSKKLSHDDIRSILKFDVINISCDTLDKDLHETIRAGSKFSVFRENLDTLLRTRAELNPNRTIFFNITESDLAVRKLDGLCRFAAQNNININFSNLFYAPDTVVDKTKCLKKVSEMSDAEVVDLWPMISSLPRRMKAENPKFDLGQTGPFFNYIKTIATRTSRDLFYPSEDNAGDSFYIAFKKKYASDSHHYLRNIYLSFDECIRGIYVKRGKTIHIPTEGPGRKVDLQATGVIERYDTNLVISLSAPFTIETDGEITLDTTLPVFEKFTHVLFSLTSRQPPLAEPPGKGMVRFGDGIFVRELLLIHEIEAFINNKLATSGQPYVIWCAGERTRFLFEWTSLAKLNIMKIVDSNRDAQGKVFGRHIISSPEEVADIAAPVLIVNVTAPYAIEQSLRSQAYRFTDYIIL